MAYRYYVSPVEDESQFFIVDSDIKSGWKLIGENTAITPTTTGFIFYADKSSGNPTGATPEATAEASPTPSSLLPVNPTAAPTSTPNTSQLLTIDEFGPSSGTGGWHNIYDYIENWVTKLLQKI
jgi:hypothetical protein